MIYTAPTFLSNRSQKASYLKNVKHAQSHSMTLTHSPRKRHKNQRIHSLQTWQLFKFLTVGYNGNLFDCMKFRSMQSLRSRSRQSSDTCILHPLPASANIMTSLRDKRPSKANVFSASKKPHGLEYLTKQKGIREIDWSLTLESVRH